MLMCSECGAHVEDNVLACVICGSNLTVPADNAGDTPTSIGMVTETEVQSVLAEAPAVDRGATDTGSTTVDNEATTTDDSDLIYTSDELDLEWITDSDVANPEEAIAPETAVDPEPEPVVARATAQVDDLPASESVPEIPPVESVAPALPVSPAENLRSELTEPLEMPGLDALREVVSTAEPGSAAMTANFGTEVVSVSDGHMGKGLIRPQVVAVESDGYHFRYDEPKTNVVKMEQTPEQTVEFRVTGEQMEKLKAEQFPMEVEAVVDTPPETDPSLAEALLADSAVDADTGEAPEVAETVAVPPLDDAIFEPVVVNLDELLEGSPEPMGEAGSEPERESEIELIEELEPENETPLPEPELTLEPQSTPEPLPVMLWDAKPKFEITSKTVSVFGHYGQVAERLDLNQVRRIALERSFWGLLFGFSTLKFFTANPAEPALVIKGVKRAGEIRALIDNYL